MKARRLRQVLSLLVMILMLTACGSTAIPSEEQSKTLFAMDTYFDLTVYGGEAEDALDAAEQEVRRLEGLWSVTDESSELSAINRSGGTAVEISGETETLLAASLSIAEETGGAFDPTIYPVLSAWGFTTQEYRIPEQDELQQLLRSVGYAQIQQQGNTVTVPEGTRLDFGAVAKGYTGGRLAAMLKEDYGVTSALLNLGGNVQTIGRKPDGSLWRIGIRDPRGETMLGVLEIEDAAVVTSGGYERYFTGKDGRDYWHIIDPATGCPAESGLISVTTVGDDGTACDALATALFVMGLDQAASYWRSHPDFEMLLVTEQDEIYLTEGLAEYFALSKSNKQYALQIINS